MAWTSTFTVLESKLQIAIHVNSLDVLEDLFLKHAFFYLSDSPKVSHPLCFVRVSQDFRRTNVNSVLKHRMLLYHSVQVKN